MAQKNNIVVISDLHLDTWDSRKIKGKTKEEHFLDCLAQKKATTKYLYIIGDLMDLPPERGTDAFPDGSPAQRVIAKLIEFSREPNTFVVYLVGNHDIGLSGFRANQDFSSPWLGRIAVSYPRIHINTPRGVILLEHGHFYDPTLLITVGDLLWDTYFGGARKQPFVHVSGGLVRSLQRRDSISSKKIWKAGELKPIPRPPMGYLEKMKNLFKQESPPVELEKDLIPGLWRKAAKEALRKYNESASPDERAIAIVFAHTHRPDEFAWTDGSHYFNCGDWCGNTSHSTYLEVDRDGNISQHDWIKEL